MLNRAGRKEPKITHLNFEFPSEKDKSSERKKIPQNMLNCCPKEKGVVYYKGQERKIREQSLLKSFNN